MHRLFVSLSAVALISGFLAAPDASAQQSVSFYLGGFIPRAIDARDNDEVPGVSMIVVSISSAAGHSTSRSRTSSGSRVAKSKVRPPFRAIGTLDRLPPR